MSEIDFIVIDLDGGEMLERCIDSIAAQRGVAVRIILVDNGSAVPARTRVRQAGVPIEHLRLDENRGFAGGANAGLELARTPLVALVNNDVTLSQEWASQLASTFDDPTVAAVQSIIAQRDGTIDGAGIGRAAGRIVQIGHGAPADAPLPPLWSVSATAALYRRTALEETRGLHGFFDARFFAYYEDVELAARLDAAGWKAARVDELLAVHAGSASAHRLGSWSDVLRTRNRYWLARLHPSVASRSALLREDIRRFTRSLLRREGSPLAIVRGVVHGLLNRVT